MKVLLCSGTEVPVPTPAEVRERRLTRNSNKSFNEYRPLSPEISAKISQIVAIRSPNYYDDAIALCFMVGGELHRRYDFLSGHRYIIGSSCIPENIRRNENEIRSFLYLTVEFLEAFGWSLTLTEDEHYYYFDFNALEQLTPGQVDQATEHKIKTLAKRAQTIIYAGLLEKKHRFSLIELELDQVRPTLFPYVYHSLITLLGPTWQLKYVDGSCNIIHITPVTPRL